MSQQSSFSTILSKKMQENIPGIVVGEIHSVDEMISPEFNQVFGHGSMRSRCRGIEVYGLA